MYGEKPKRVIYPNYAGHWFYMIESLSTEENDFLHREDGPYQWGKLTGYYFWRIEDGAMFAYDHY
jgi:hypothetical protein